MPFVLLGDARYSLKNYLLRSYTNQNIDSNKEIFNNRLSRARWSVECPFGIFVAKWRCLKIELQLEPNHVDSVVKCACILHNIIIDKEGVDESVLTNLQEKLLANTHPVRNHNRSTREAYIIRDKFKDYFNGARTVQFQYNRN